ncbi:MAG TPA: YkgJ family cysteine cluster protein [Thermodesulfobacteriota bacterium]|nr:YkgJ family cysteine cluster protein [Thermodesulfobacteriota bacterium]
MLKKSLFENYQNLLIKIDAFSSSITQRYQQDLCCARGCSDCCQQELSLFPLEFFFLRHQIGSHPEVRRARTDFSSDLSAATACILLHKGSCLLYPYRPVICRTHGLPLLIRPDQGEFRDCCPKNFFQRPLQTIPAADVLDLERINTLLAVLNRAFAVQTGIDPGQRIGLNQLFSDDFRIA